MSLGSPAEMIPFKRFLDAVATPPNRCREGHSRDARIDLGIQPEVTGRER